MESELVPYVPRLLLEWQRDTPGETWRAIEGTLVFIDLSGFTAMSEKLARKGKVGAEEVTEVLGETFSELLRVAYDVGGGLLKFGGDALLLWFSGNEHAQRGTFAAAEMRRTLRRIGRIKTSAGNVTLRMTVGVHSGDFHFFLAGDSHKELVVTGPEASQTVAMESAAEAGEILLSPDTSSRIDRSFLGEFKDGGCLLAKVPPAPHHEELVALPEVNEVKDFVPTAIRKHLLGGGEEAEHRQVTVGFIQFEGTDELIDQKGPDEASARLHSLISAVQAAVQEFGICFLSTDIDTDGGKIILTAGAPHATENDDDRMLRALLRIQESDYGLGIRIGVHQGHVFTGSIGPFYRRTYTVMGDAVNTAARVMSGAEAGDLLATSEVLERSETLYSTTEVPAFLAKGKSRPINASRVIKPVGPKLRKLLLELPLVGRDEELKLLLEDLEAASKGQGRVAELIGESGLGKSRLLAELKSLTSLPNFEVSGQQYGSSTPYFAFRALMRSLCEVTESSDPVSCERSLKNKFREVAPELLPWLPLLAAVMDVQVGMTPEVERLDAELRKSKLHEVTLVALQKLVPGASLWIFEDVHWFDPSSIELLRYLLERAADLPWLLCITTRPREQDLSEGVDQARVIALSPLTPDASTALARASDEMLLPQHASVLARRSGGNPLFLLELVASYGIGEDLGSLPESVEAVISARIDHLNPTLRTLLRNLSVFGRETDLQTLREVSELGAYVLDESAWGHLSEFVEIKQGSVGFRQALYRDVAYEGLPFGRRRALHGLVAKVLEERPDRNENAELLSLHFHSALIYDKTWRYSLAAAKKAEAKFAFVAAASFYRRATECMRRLSNLTRDEVVSAWESLGLALKEAGQFKDAMDAYRRGRAAAKDDARALARLALWEGYARERVGQYPQALQWITRGLRLLDGEYSDSESRKTRTRLKVAASEIRYFQGKLMESISWGRQAVEEAELLGDDYELGRAYYALLAPNTAAADPSAVSLGERALKIFEASEDMKLQANVLNSLGMLAYYQGAWDRALELYKRSRFALEQAGHVLGAAIVTSNAAEILSDQGKLQEAEDEFHRAIATARATRHSRAVQVITSNLGRAAARGGRFEKAYELFTEALEGFQALGASDHVVETKLRLAEAYAFEGKTEKAISLLNEISDVSGPTLQAMLHRTKAYALAQAGNTDEAIESLKESLRLARHGKQEFEAAFTLEALGRLSTARQARQYRDAAAEIFERLGFVSTPAVPLAPKSSSR